MFFYLCLKLPSKTSSFGIDFLKYKLFLIYNLIT